MNEQGPQGRTAIHAASFRPSEDIIQYLLEHGADLSIKDQTGTTVREAAAKSGNKKTMATLERLEGKK